MGSSENFWMEHYGNGIYNYYQGTAMKINFIFCSKLNSASFQKTERESEFEDKAKHIFLLKFA